MSVSGDTINILGIDSITIETLGASGTCNLINFYNQITGSNTGFGTPANYILADTNGSYNQMTAGYGTNMGYNQIDSQNVTGSYANLIIARNGDNKIVSNTGANNIIGVKNSISSNITTPLVPADGYTFLQALIGISNYIGSVATFTQTSILSTIANATIALTGNLQSLGTTNSMIANLSSTLTGTNTIQAQGSSAFPYATNLIATTGLGGTNTIQGGGTNCVNNLKALGANGVNNILATGTSGNNNITATSNNNISATQNTITSTTNNNIVNTGPGTNTITSLVSNTITSPLNTISANSAGGNNVFTGNAGAGNASNLIQATSGYNQLLGNAGTGVVSNTMYASSGDNKMNAINAGCNNILVANVANSLTASQNTITSTTNNNIVNTGTGTNTITSLVSNTLTAPTIALSGTNITMTAFFNYLTATASNGYNEMYCNGTSAFNSMVADGGTTSSGGNFLSYRGTGGANFLQGATICQDSGVTASAVTIQNSNGINVVNATTHATYNASSVPLMSLSASYTFNTAPTLGAYVVATQCDTTSFGTTIQGGMAFPVNVIPVGYYIGSDTGAISSSPVNVTLQVFQYSGLTILATSGAIGPFTTLVSSNYNGKFSSPTSATAGNAYGVQMNLSTIVVSNAKKFRVIIFFAQW